MYIKRKMKQEAKVNKASLICQVMNLITLPIKVVVTAYCFRVIII